MRPIDWPRVHRALLTARLEQDTRVRRVRALIDDAYAEALDLDTLARVACLSRAQLVRAFRQTYDVTPRQYVIERRVEAARRLLEGTAMPVTEVCLEVGFSSLGSFSTLFKRRTGKSPDAYRRAWVTSLGLPAPMVPGCFAMRFAPASSTMRIFEKSSPPSLG